MGSVNGGTYSLLLAGSLALQTELHQGLTLFPMPDIQTPNFPELVIPAIGGTD